MPRDQEAGAEVTDRSPEPRRGGRPRKFQGPSRVVTLTLPRETIDQLSDIHEDRAKAIVKAARFATMGSQDDETRVDLIEVGPNLAMIAVPYCKYLQQVPEVSLVQIVPNRFLIVIAAGSPLSAIEIGVEDQLELLGPDEARDRTILTQVLERLRAARRAHRASLASVVLVETP
jgi:hypothetical protein